MKGIAKGTFSKFLNSFLLLSNASFYNKKRPKLCLTLPRTPQELLPWPQRLELEILFVEWGWGHEPKWISGLPELTILMQIQQLAMPQLWKLEKIPHIRWWERLVGKSTSILLLSSCHLLTQCITLTADLGPTGYKLIPVVPGRQHPH